MNYKVIHETCFLRDYYLGQGKFFSVDGIHFFIYMCIYIHIYAYIYYCYVDLCMTLKGLIKPKFASWAGHSLLSHLSSLQQ